MVPVSTMNVPATALSSVDFPEPFVPITIRKEPDGRERETSVSALTSLGVPGLKVFDMRWISSMGSSHLGQGTPARAAIFQPVRHVGQHQRGEHKNGGDEFEVVGTESPTQGDGHQHAEQYGAHDRSGDEQANSAGAYQGLADDYASYAQHHHPDSHLHI